MPARRSVTSRPGGFSTQSEDERIEGLGLGLGEGATDAIRRIRCTSREIFRQFAVPNAGRLGDCPLCRDPFLIRAAAIITLVGLHTHPLVDWRRCARVPKRWLISTAAWIQLKWNRRHNDCCADLEQEPQLGPDAGRHAPALKPNDSTLVARPNGFEGKHHAEFD